MNSHNPNKILLVSLSNLGGGASKIVSELFTGLQEIGFDTELIIFEGTPGKGIYIFNNNFIKNLIFRLKNLLVKLTINTLSGNKLNYQSINIFESKLLSTINNSDASIVHLHWIGAEMISIKQINKINKKIIWTMHDAWPLNGSCHINPNDYISNYQISNTYFEKSINVLDRFTLKRKIKYLSEKAIIFTSPSKWLKEKFEASFYNKEKSSCLVIPNFIDITKWNPISKELARNKLEIKSRKQLLAFGSNFISKSYNKGFHFILELMQLLSPEKYGFILFGIEDKGIEFNDKFEIHHLGKISNEEVLKTIYSASDITIVPSLSESFSLVSLESISCNTPVLAFDTSGIRDIVIHKANGYLARQFELSDLLNGVLWLTNNKLNNIHKTVARFSKELVIQQYIELYGKLNLKNITLNKNPNEC